MAILTLKESVLLGLPHANLKLLCGIKKHRNVSDAPQFSLGSSMAHVWNAPRINLTMLHLFTLALGLASLVLSGK